MTQISRPPSGQYHQMAGQATFDASYRYARDHHHFPEHLAEGLETHKVAEIDTTMAEDPEVVIDVSDVIETRIKALQAPWQPDRGPRGVVGANPCSYLGDRREPRVQVRRGVSAVLFHPFELLRDKPSRFTYTSSLSSPGSGARRATRQGVSLKM